MLRRRAARVSLISLVVALAACAPDDRSGSVRAWVFARDPATNTYRLDVERIDDLDSLRELRGRDIDVRRDTSLTEGLDGTVAFDLGAPFAMEYSFDDAGNVVPGDEDLFYALSLYRILDQMAALMRAHGHVPLKPLTVYYLPRWDSDVTGDARLLETDNEAYISEGKGFLILPPFVLSNLPLTLNEGVLAHEFGHSVIHEELFGAAPGPTNATSSDPDWMRIQQHLLAMHEGVADLFGFARTGDPDFIAPSLDADRDLSVPRSLSQAMADSLDALQPPDALLGTSTFDPHVAGSVLARTVYELWPKAADGTIDEAGRGALIDAILVALRSIHDQGLYDPAHDFTLATFPNELVLALPESQRANACAVLEMRFAPLASGLTHCEGG